jgi:hypothetical protein
MSKKKKKIEDKKVAEKNDSISTSNLKVFNMFKTMPQAKFNLQNKTNIESGKVNDEKTHFEVSKNFNEAKKFKPSVGQEINSQLPNPNQEKKEKNKKIIKNKMGQHTPLKKNEKSKIKSTGKDQPCEEDNNFVRDKKNTPNIKSWLKDQRDKENTPQPINVHPFQTKVTLKDLTSSEAEVTIIATTNMPNMFKKESAGVQDKAQNSSDEELLLAVLELEKKRRLKKAKEQRMQEADKRDQRRKAEEDIIFGSDDDELLEAALAIEHDQGARQQPDHQDQAQGQEGHEQHVEGGRSEASHHLPLGGATGSTGGNQEMMVPAEQEDGQVTGGAALAKQGDHQGEAVQGQEVEQVLQDDHQLLQTPQHLQRTPPRTSSSSPPGGHTPVRVLCTPLWKRMRDKRMSSSSSSNKPRRSSQGAKPRTRRTSQLTSPSTPLRSEEPKEPECARPGSISPQIDACAIIATQPKQTEEKAATKFDPTGDKPTEMK